MRTGALAAQLFPTKSATWTAKPDPETSHQRFADHATEWSE